MSLKRDPWWTALTMSRWNILQKRRYPEGCPFVFEAQKSVNIICPIWHLEFSSARFLLVTSYPATQELEQVFRSVEDPRRLGEERMRDTGQERSMMVHLLCSVIGILSTLGWHAMLRPVSSTSLQKDGVQCLWSLGDDQPRCLPLKKNLRYLFPCGLDSSRLPGSWVLQRSPVNMRK